MFASRLQRVVYAKILKPFFFRRDPEAVHDHIVRLGARLGASPFARRAVRALMAYEHPALEQHVLGIRFANPVGLTAGFDKNAELIDIVPAVGFGFTEIGSVTGEPCEGNPKPRLWRLPQSQGLVVWYGLKNDGCEAIAGRLRGRTPGIPLGTSVARTNAPETVSTEAGIADYVKAFRAMAAIGDYTTVNISCPNTCGGEPFHDPERLEMLLTALDAIPTKKPVLLKIAVDLSHEEIDALVAVCDRHRVQGFIVANLTKRYDRATIHEDERQLLEKGGVSGRPVKEPSTALIAYLYQTCGARYVIVGSGGIFSAEDAYVKICAGASLVQLATGMIFEGPQVIGEINRGLVQLLHRDGFGVVREAVGSMHR